MTIQMIEYFEDQIEATNEVDPLLFYVIDDINYIKDFPNICLRMESVYLSKFNPSDFSHLEFVKFINNIPKFKYKIHLN